MNYRDLPDCKKDDMNLSKVFPVLAFIVIAMSCSKEESFERERSGDKKEMLLVKVTQEPVGESYKGVNTLSYDKNGKLIHYINKIEGKVDGPYSEGEEIYYRNDKGNIDSILSIAKGYDEDGKLVETDSVLVKLYTSNTGEYKYGISFFEDDDGNRYLDSLVYTYDNSGRIVQVRLLLKMNNSLNYVDYQTSTYSYDDNGNVSALAIKFFGNNQDPPQMLTFGYNDSLSPFDLGNDGRLMGFISLGINSRNGLVSITDSEDGAVWQINYDEFNSEKKPVKALWTNLTTQEKINYTYYYQ